MIKQNDVLLIDRDIESLRKEVKREIELVKKLFDNFEPVDYQVPSVIISTQGFMEKKFIEDSQLKENLRELNL